MQNLLGLICPIGYIQPLEGILNQEKNYKVLPGAQYICSVALELISDWTSLHWPKNVKHTFPVKTQ